MRHEDGIKFNSIFFRTRASLATSQGSELMPIGENGKGTFFNACAFRIEAEQRNTTCDRVKAKFRTALRSD